MKCTGPGPGGPQEPGTGGGLRLFVFRHAGGWSLVFRDRPGRFPPGRRVRAPDAPGRGPLPDPPPPTGGGAPAAHFPARLTPEITAARAPFAFFGHRMGSLVAHQLTRRLPAEGPTAPVWPGISACGAPQPGAERAPLPGGAPSDDAVRHRPAAPGGTRAPLRADPRRWTVFAPALRAGLAVPRGLRAAPAGAVLPVALFAFAGARGRAAPPARIAPWAGRPEHLPGLRVFPGGRFPVRDGPDALAAQVTADVHTARRARAAAAGAR
jgi:surfactin synthase thioesterase subunit